MPPMNALLALLVVLFYVLHQDVWFWRDARPLVFGFLPIGLFYHAVYTVAVSGLMWLMVRYAWPAQLERGIDAPERADGRDRYRSPGTGEGPAAPAASEAAPAVRAGTREHEGSQGEGGARS